MGERDCDRLCSGICCVRRSNLPVKKMQSGFFVSDHLFGDRAPPSEPAIYLFKLLAILIAGGVGEEIHVTSLSDNLPHLDQMPLPALTAQNADPEHANGKIVAGHSGYQQSEACR